MGLLIELPIQDPSIETELDVNLSKMIIDRKTHGNYRILISKEVKEISIKPSYTSWTSKGTTTKENHLFIYLDVYVDSRLLLSLYKSDKLPYIIRDVVTSNLKKFNVDNYIKDIKIDVAINEKISKNDIDKYYKVNLFEYQRNNLNWMLGIEKMVDRNQTKLFYMPLKGLYVYPINCIEDNIFLKKQGFNYSVINHNDKITKEINFTGGVLSDEVGLGKTLSMISLILSNLPEGLSIEKVTSKTKKRLTKKDKEAKIKLDKEYKPKKTKGGKYISKCTVVICPNRLCAQWEDEIKKYLKDEYKIVTYTLATIVKLRSLSIRDLCEGTHIIFVPFTFLTNKNYHKRDDFKLDDFEWNRVIIDESHELLTDELLISKKTEREANEEVYKIRGKYNWVCTGTPLSRGKYNYFGILKWICRDSTPDCYDYAVLKSKEVISKYFRYNSKESVKDDIFIPKIVEENIFLTQTQIEKALYLSAKGDNTRMIQLCTHILVSEADASIIGNKLLPLETIHKMMVEHYRKEIIKFTNKKEKVKKELEDYEEYSEDRLDKLHEKLDIITDKIDDYSDLMDGDEDDFKIYSDSELDSESDSESEDLKFKEKDKSGKTSRRVLSKRIEVLKEKKEKLQETIDEYSEKSEEKTMELKEKFKVANNNLITCESKKKLFDRLDEHVKEVTKEPCIICYEEFDTVMITLCGHIICGGCMVTLFQDKNTINCFKCRTVLRKEDIKSMYIDNRSKEEKKLSQWGTKMEYLIKLINRLVSEKDSNRFIIFSQWDRILKLVSNVLTENNIKNLFIKGNTYVVANTIRKFKYNKDYKVLMLSSDSCSSGSNLTEANHIILLDTINAQKSESKAIEDQAIGRAVRIGQKQNVHVYRLIMKDTIEHEYFIRNMS